MLDGQIKDNFTYHPHQIETIKRLVKNSRQVISFGTGTGKTMAFLGGFAACRKLGFGTRAIIICDKSSVVSIVADVEEKSNLTYFFFDEKQAVIPNDCDLLLITYNRADQVLSQIDVKQFSHLIFDEAHKLKNEESGVSKDLSFYRDQFKYIWFSTATLMSNSIQDLHGMFSWLVPELFPNWWEFRKQYCILKKRNVKMFRRGKTGKQYQVKKEIEEIVGYQNLELLKEKIEPYVCYYTKDHEIEFHEIQVVLNEDEKEHYLAASKGFDERKLRDDDIVPHSVRLHDLQLTIDNGREGNTSKQKVLSDYLYTNQMFGSIVYFSYKESLFQVYEKYKKQFEIEVITGEVSSIDRKRIKQWLKPGRFLFMTDAGGQSLNLDSVDRLVFYDIPFSIVTVSQAIGRIVRMSSPYKKFHVYFLNTKDTIDSYKYNLVSTHAELIKWILGGYKNLPDMKYHSPEHMRTLRKSLLWKK